MKIHQVTMTGFGPYRDTETVDFDAFDDDGIFLITGRTGAGKTSILDAVTYALFGSIPRYDGVAGEKVRSNHIGPTDPCRVTVELSTADGRFRVTRSPAFRRPKQRGTGTTTVPPAFELARLVGDQWEVVESKTGNAEVHIEEIVRLSAKQFLQVILLAQGQFQEFLVATSDKRRELLRMLFDTRRFSDYSEALDARARALGERLTSSSTAVGAHGLSLVRETGGTLPDDVDLTSGTGVQQWVEDLLTARRLATSEAAVTAETTRAEHDDIRNRLDAARSMAERQKRRAAALARQAELEVILPDVDESRLRLDEARRAELVWHRVEASRAAQQTLYDAGERHRITTQAFRQLLPDEPVDDEAVGATVQVASELLGSLRDAADKEASLDGLRAAVQAAGAALTAFDEQVALHADARAELRLERESLKTSLPSVEKAAAQLPAAAQALTAARDRLSAATLASRTARQVEQAQQHRLSAGRAVTEASARRDELRAGQRAGFAGVLAQSLEPGQPCLVCGSPAHPSPAVLADDHVDEADVDEAEAAYDEAVGRSHDADLALGELTAQLDAERRAAGGEDVEALTPQVAEAEAELASTTAAADELRATATALELVDVRIDELGQQIDSAHERRHDLVKAEAAASTTHDEVVRALVVARDVHATVIERVALVTSHVRAGRSLLESIAALRDAVERDAAAAELLAASLAEHELDDVAAVEDARLGRREQDEVETRIRAHDADAKAVVSALASPDLHDVPDEPVDVATLQTRFDDVDARNQRAVADHSRAATVLCTVEGLAADIIDALEAAAVLRAEHAVVDRLASTVRGQTPNTMKMALETFALAAELEEIVRAANSRLGAMTGGRYEFLHSDALAGRGAQSGLALDVLDAFTGDTRAPQSLSGGEKFQASLALALGLAEVLTHRAGGVRPDTLFIDEGFGSLDADTLETTMATLDNLREGGRTIGLISHVEAMKESIPAQLHVDRTDGGWSTIRTS